MYARIGSCLFCIASALAGMSAWAFDATDRYPANSCAVARDDFNMRRATIMCDTDGVDGCNKISCPIILAHPRQPDRLKSVQVFFSNDDPESVNIQLCLQHADENNGPFRCLTKNSKELGETSVTFDSKSSGFSNFQKYSDGYVMYIRAWLYKYDQLFSYRVTWDLPCRPDPDVCPQ